MEVVSTGNGERLQITAPRRGTSIRLDPVELEALTWQTTDTFTRMLEGSIGPCQPELAVGEPDFVKSDDRAPL
ncbi:dihydrodiol dehydrogenase [Mycobacterium sp. CBMA293]|nr:MULTISPECIES: dihydrodiol dehydrogenase [unclassified Mycolicibacterium]MUL58877.1 dihydrodiol dehydrogenase [Mycolicibacterium sp. CBMA 335]MUL69271.1 dihydrodiol dehydrogenase [Mycolicibacterium sp. CBMA 311]MUM05250.1 dihydrodiol dehydrogenase [Mycolicibacterium sp. CBMA 213]MUM11364.1 dihydrodiol dehydrogenase [Mycolicibacterium sp. CBMA 293]MUL46074.1 dihydrodiol dehydrogenase [Mycolicibacterium sp. CBMA 360]